MTFERAAASFVCVGIFILIVWQVTGFSPKSWQCWALTISANLMLLPACFSRKSSDRKESA